MVATSAAGRLVDGATFAASAVEAVEASVNAAAAAFADWSGTPAEARADHLRGMAAAVEANGAALARTAAGEIGASAQWMAFNVDLAARILRQAASLAPQLADRHVLNAEAGTRSIVRRQAAGVVAGFAPWNAPVILAVRALAVPLLAGNTVVLKASEHCPETHALLLEILNGTGLPPGVAGVVNNAPEEAAAVVSALVAHPAVRRINFTGSTRVGREIAVEAARHLKRCLLELSGKAPQIVLEDADLDAAADAALFGAFFNQGQICMSTERIVVVEAVADAFVDRLVARARDLTAADPAEAAADLGRLVSAQAAVRVGALIAEATHKGARLLAGGTIDGAVMQPAVLDRVAPNMAIYHEESFGPVACVLRVRDEEEAVSIANDTAYGLAAAVFSRDEARALRVADRLETGIVQINGSTVHDDPDMPFGGMKASGYGRFGGAAALDEFTELRWIAVHEAGRTPAL